MFYTTHTIYAYKFSTVKRLNTFIRQPLYAKLKIPLKQDMKRNIRTRRRIPKKKKKKKWKKEKGIVRTNERKEKVGTWPVLTYYSRATNCETLFSLFLSAAAYRRARRANFLWYSTGERTQRRSDKRFRRIAVADKSEAEFLRSIDRGEDSARGGLVKVPTNSIS